MAASNLFIQRNRIWFGCTVISQKVERFRGCVKGRRYRRPTIPVLRIQIREQFFSLYPGSQF